MHNKGTARKTPEKMRGRPITPYRPDSATRKAIDEFCDAHGINKQEFLDRATALLLDSGLDVLGALSAEERELALRLVQCYRADPEQAERSVEMLEKWLELSKK